MSWSLVQSASTAATSSSSSTATVTPGSNLSSGTKLIIAIGWASGSTTTVSTVKDASSNSFTKMQSAPNSGGPSGCDLWQLDTPAGDVGAKPVITVTFSGSVQASLLLQEVSGLATGTTTAAVLDGTAGTKTGNGGSSTGIPTYVSSVSSEYLVSVYGDDGGPETLGTVTGLTKDTHVVSANSFSDVGIAYGNSTGTTETNGSWALSGSSAEWGMILVAFKLAAGGSPGNVNLTTPNLALAAPALTPAGQGNVSLTTPNLALGAPALTPAGAGNVSLTAPNLALGAPAVIPSGSGTPANVNLTTPNLALSAPALTPAGAANVNLTTPNLALAAPAVTPGGGTPGTLPSLIPGIPF